jgi:hypothetical protein
MHKGATSRPLPAGAALDHNALEAARVLGVGGKRHRVTAERERVGL